MLNSRMLRKIQCTQRSIERYMLGITRRDRKRNTLCEKHDQGGRYRGTCEKVEVVFRDVHDH
jgi:hypothetical protein